jgi:splicing factor U2AF subunit
MLDFRCVEEANNALVLNGMSFKGQELKISRPKHYSGSQPTSVNSMNCLFGNFAIKNAKKRAIEDICAAGDRPVKTIDPPSRVLCLKRIVKNSDFQTEAEYLDILDDIRVECLKFGKIDGIFMPKPGEKGCGNCYVAYETVEEAMNARRVLSGKRFNGKFVEPGFHPEVMFMEKDFRETWELRALAEG